MTIKPLKNLNPDKVDQLCSENRWSSKGLAHASSSLFGTVPESFEQAALMLPEGSKQREQLTDAFKRAASIYRDQILADVRKDTTGRPRAQLESINEALAKKARSLEGNGTYVSARLIWAAHMVGDWYYKNGGKKGPASGPGYQQFKF